MAHYDTLLSRVGADPRLAGRGVSGQAASEAGPVGRVMTGKPWRDERCGRCGTERDGAWREEAGGMGRGVAGQAVRLQCGGTRRVRQGETVADRTAADETSMTTGRTVAHRKLVGKTGTVTSGTTAESRRQDGSGRDWDSRG